MYPVTCGERPGNLWKLTTQPYIHYTLPSRHSLIIFPHISKNYTRSAEKMNGMVLPEINAHVTDNNIDIYR